MAIPNCPKCGSRRVNEAGRYGIHWFCRRCANFWLKGFGEGG